jgi:hypothetical protein
MEAGGEPPVRSALGAPLWIWRRTLQAAALAGWGYILGRANDARTFAAELELRQFIGFYTERNLPFLRHRHFDRT